MSYATGVFVGRVADDAEQLQGRYPADFYQVEVHPLAGTGPGADPDAPERVEVSILPSFIRRVQPGPGARLLCRRTLGFGWVAERLAVRLEMGPLLGYQGAEVSNEGIVWEVANQIDEDDPEASTPNLTADEDGIARWVTHREIFPGTNGAICRPINARARIDTVDGRIYPGALSGQDVASGPVPTADGGFLAWAPCYKVPLLKNLVIRDAATGALKATLFISSNLWPGIFTNYGGDLSGDPTGGGWKMDFNGDAPVLKFRPAAGADLVTITAATHHGPPSMALEADPAHRFQATFNGPDGTYTAQE